MAAKVAAVEDFDSVIQETLPSSRREAYRKTASKLGSVTNSSDTGTIDSGYSSNSTANFIGEIFPESPTRPTAHGDLSKSDHNPLSRPNLTSQSSSKQDGRQSRSANPHRTSGSYSYGPHSLQTRPPSRATNKPNGRDSPAVRCPPINTKTGGDECDCKDCNSTSTSRPSPMIPPTSGGLESPWTLDLRNGLPFVSPGSWGSTPLSTSPGNTRSLGGSKTGFPFETFGTIDSAGSGSGSLGSSRPQSYNSSSNPLAAWNSQYDYTASPGPYTPASVNPLHSPPPYLGSGAQPSWMQPQSGLGSQSNEFPEDYGYPPSSQDYLYGSGSGTMSASAGLAGGYALPPRSASVQPVSASRRQRSSSYQHRAEIPDFSAMPPPAPRQSSSRVPPNKRLHSATNSYDSRFDASMPQYETNYDIPYDNTNYEEYGPSPPINRRLSRSGAPGTGTFPALDITRATSVPPADNYLTGIDRARRMSSMTPQPLAIQQRERARRGSNSSSGLSAARRAHEAQLDQLVEQVIVEKRPELALTKRNSGASSGALTGRHDLGENNYTADAYDAHDGYANYESYGHEYASYENNAYESPGMDFGLHEKAMILRGDTDSEPYTVRYPTGTTHKLQQHHATDYYQRPLRVNVERRKSMHRRNSDFPHTREHVENAAELEQMRSAAISRGSGADRRSRRQIEYDHGGFF